MMFHRKYLQHCPHFFTRCSFICQPNEVQSNYYLHCTRSIDSCRIVKLGEHGTKTSWDLEATTCVRMCENTWECVRIRENALEDVSIPRFLRYNPKCKCRGSFSYGIGPICSSLTWADSSRADVFIYRFLITSRKMPVVSKFIKLIFPFFFFFFFFFFFVNSIVRLPLWYRYVNSHISIHYFFTGFLSCFNQK